MTDNNINNSMLTTIDNPFNPFTQYDQWFAYDREKGYDTPNYLARIAKVSDDLSDEEEALAIEQAIDEIVLMNVLGIYIKVSPDNFNPIVKK